MYDYLIVGAGLYGAVFAQKKTEQGKKCLVIDKRAHIAGNVYSEETEGIQVHRYGPHIFHTDNREIWEYVHRFADFNNFIYSPVADYKGELYNLPFNMNTFSRMWGVRTPGEAAAVIRRQREEAGISTPKSLEEQAIFLVGRDIYEKLVKGYTQKQWGRPCTELPPFLIKRLPVRYTFDNNYFSHPYQGIPVGGYTAMVDGMLEGTEVRLETDFLAERDIIGKEARKIVYTGPADMYFDCCYGALAYRSLRFETELLDMENYQGVAGMNYTDADTPYTRIVEHKHFEPGRHTERTVVTREYPAEWRPGDEPYYPVNDGKNMELYHRYEGLMKREKNVWFGGRLGMYQYLDMDQAILHALRAAEQF